ncbi:MAG: hypothetical protein QNK29_15895 [Desulfobacterales bacterium]|nr:hypothetical protein [Desulfobacterales bacterium]
MNFPRTTRATKFSALLALPLAFVLSICSAQAMAQGHTRHMNVNMEGHVSDNVYGAENLAYYGDWNSNTIYIFDVDHMSLIATVEGTGDGPYGIDQQSPEKAYALTRRVESLTIVDNQTLQNSGFIPLAHKPRSTSYNPGTDLSLVSGGDKAMTSIIKVKTDKVVRVVGEDALTVPTDFGGSLSTGHPKWVAGRKFFMIDRAAREIQLWHFNNRKLATLQTTTSVHHIFQAPVSTGKKGGDHVYYAVEEGNRDKAISPAILRFKLKGNRLVETGRVALNSIDPSIYDASTMGAHHAAFRPDGKYIYVGSAEGNLFVIHSKSMKVKKVIEVGLGAGHATFVPKGNQAIITNHNDTFVSVIDTDNHEWVRNVEVASSASPDYKSQAHTSGVSLDEQYFYSAASHDGIFYRIDLHTWVVEQALSVDANMLMGSFIWDGDNSGGM